MKVGVIYAMKRGFLKVVHLIKTVEKFTELCNSNEHYFKVKISFELKYKGIKTSTWVIVWNEKDRKVVLNYTPTLLYALNTDE